MRKLYILIVIGTLAFLAGCNQQKSDIATVSPLDQMGSSNAVTISLNEQGATAVTPAETMATSETMTQEISSDAAATTTPTNQQIQQALKNAGLYQGPVDGVLGKKSKKAITEFQEQNGLNADGKVGKRTWAKLEPYLNASPTTTTSTGQTN